MFALHELMYNDFFLHLMALPNIKVILAFTANSINQYLAMK